MQLGKSGAFRVLCYYLETTNTVYPFFIYTKKEYEKAVGEQPTAKEIKRWIADLKERLAAPAETWLPDDAPLEHSCPNCGPAVGLLTVRAEFEILLECPDCQRAYTTRLQPDGSTELIPLV